MKVRILKKLNRNDCRIDAKYDIFNLERTPVGEVNVEFYCLYNMCDIRYKIYPEYQNKGYGTDAVKEVLKDVFANKTLDDFTFKNAYGQSLKTKCEKVSLDLPKGNIQSKRIAEKNGFELQERTQYYFGEITKEKFCTKRRNAELEL